MSVRNVMISYFNVLHLWRTFTDVPENRQYVFVLDQQPSSAYHSLHPTLPSSRSAGGNWRIQTCEWNDQVEQDEVRNVPSSSRCKLCTCQLSNYLAFNGFKRGSNYQTS